MIKGDAAPPRNINEMYDHFKNLAQSVKDAMGTTMGSMDAELQNTMIKIVKMQKKTDHHMTSVVELKREFKKMKRIQFDDMPMVDQAADPDMFEKDIPGIQKLASFRRKKQEETLQTGGSKRDVLNSTQKAKDKFLSLKT